MSTYGDTTNKDEWLQRYKQDLLIKNLPFSLCSNALLRSGSGVTLSVKARCFSYKRMHSYESKQADFGSGFPLVLLPFLVF